MTVDIGTARGRIEIDTVGVQKSLNAAQNALSSFGKAAGLAFGALGIGAGAAAVAAVKSGVSMTAMLETTQLQFETLMGSADAAREHVADLFEIAKKTPFETEPIIAASKKLRTFGGDALDTKERLIAIGDAAAATGGPIDDLAFWVGRLYSNLQGGKPFGEAAMRLQELTVLSPQAQQEMERLQKSGASAEEVFAVFEQSLGRFGGAMAKQAETLPGLVATVKDAIKLGLGDAFAPVADGLKTGLKEAIAVLDAPETTAAIARFATQLGSITAAVVPFVVEHGPALLKLLGNLAVALGAMSVAAKVGGVVLKLAAAWGSVSAAVAGGSSALSAVVALLGGPVTLAIGAVVAAVAALAVAWANDWGGIREKTAAAWDFISGKVAEGMAAIRRFIEPGLAAIRAFWDEHGAAIMRAVDQLWAGLKRAFEAGFNLLLFPFRVFRAAFQGDWEEVGRQVRGLWENTVQALVDISEHLWEALRPAFEALGRKMIEWWSNIEWANIGRQAAVALVEGFREGTAAGGAFNGPTVVERMIGSLEKTNPVYALVGKLIKGIPALQQAGADMVKGFKEGAEGEFEDEELAEMAAAYAREMADRVAQEAASADRAMTGYAEAWQEVGQSADDAGRSISGWDAYLRASHNNLKLGADRSLHFAGGIDALTAAAARNKAELDAAALAAQNYASAFAGVQSDYVTELPQADKPLVAPEQDVTIRTRVSGPTPEQAALAAQYTAELDKLRETYSELTAGIGTFGMEQGKLDEKIAETAGEIAHYEGLLAGIPPTVDNVSTSHQGLKVNVDAARQGIYNQLVQMEAAPEIIAAYAAATGIMSEAQAEAVLQAAAVKVKIDELAQSIAAGMPIDQALADLDAFIAKIETGVAPATEALKTTVPQDVTDMGLAMWNESITAGTNVPDGVAQGITDNLDTATTAATEAADAITQAVRDAHGIESPSSVFADIGGQDIAGFVAGVEDSQGDAVSVMERVAQATVDAWDSTIEAADGIGVAIMDGVIAGVESRRGELVAKMEEIATEAYEKAMAKLKAASPSKLFMQMGKAIIDGVIAGLDATKDTLYGKLTDIANTLYGIGSGVFGLQADALEEQVNDSTDRLTAALDGLRSAFGDTPIDNLLGMDPDDRAYFLRTLRGASAAGNLIVSQQLEEAIRLADERNALEDEYIRQQEELARLEEQRTRLDFLQQQVELLDLIRENNLSTGILDGLKLGLDANMTDVIAAMTEAMRELVERASDELGIASPSTVFTDIGRQVMAGLARGLGQTAEIERRMREATGRLTSLGVADARALESRLRSVAAQPLRLDTSGLNPAQTVYIYGGYNPQVENGELTADPLRSLFFQNLGYQGG